MDAVPNPEARDQALAELEKKLQAIEDARKEERFIWIVVCTILIDILWLSGSENAALSVIVLILELVVLFVLARRMGVEDIERLMDRILHSVSQKGGGG
ncbi:hypothetical protein V7S57_03800 [Caulobacter sp. CCNWLY153]|uniref:hypothetical protein n=1 Tax=unclassified Caulobacter TaxID=2648921 RepID=UPI002FEECF78